MQKRKLFIILAAILTISLVGLSATCLAPGEAPTLELEIYDGPDYSESDGMCYYRVEATATGMPESEIVFADDDNISPLGSGRVEVGVEIGDSYTLAVTATNSAGTATVSIVLEGECGEGVPDEEGAETDADSDEEADADEDADADADADAEKEVPTISLEVYEGPFPVESICVYRVRAIVTGSPNPTVTFSKDDSGGSWGTKKAQVNLNDPGDTYTLTATATNSEGSATDSIALSWGCEEPEPEPEQFVDMIGADPGLSGYILVNTSAHPGWTNAFVGDHSSDKPMKAYLSYNISNISALNDVTINDVSVSIPVNLILNHPELAGSEIHIKVFYYGDTLTLADQVVGGELVKTLAATDSLTNMNFSSNKLEDELQEAVDINRDWFQIKIGLSGVSVDGVNDYYQIPISNTSITIEYEIPG